MTLLEVTWQRGHLGDTQGVGIQCSLQQHKTFHKPSATHHCCQHRQYVMKPALAAVQLSSKQSSSKNTREYALLLQQDTASKIRTHELVWLQTEARTIHTYASLAAVQPNLDAHQIHLKHKLSIAAAAASVLIAAAVKPLQSGLTQTQEKWLVVGPASASPACNTEYPACCSLSLCCCLTMQCGSSCCKTCKPDQLG